MNKRRCPLKHTTIPSSAPKLGSTTSGKRRGSVSVRARPLAAKQRAAASNPVCYPKILVLTKPGLVCAVLEGELWTGSPVGVVVLNSPLGASLVELPPSAGILNCEEEPTVFPLFSKTVPV
jgi:hypothetical protein